MAEQTVCRNPLRQITKRRDFRIATASAITQLIARINPLEVEVAASRKRRTHGCFDAKKDLNSGPPSETEGSSSFGLDSGRNEKGHS
ncbi:hypothetical protein [Stutzerimonas nitrititolerans]|uniref:hypothetical protein n=1 Tax=Stutzerimonas nitrititolerans TaxID=2482751 RepID=UPI0028971AB3|nr:hypothetical protein [Stutzerimonas nitrititolerans]